MASWLYTLVSPRPTFPSDMTDGERVLMRDHVAYWRSLVDSGKVLAFGPVVHPRGEFGGLALLVLDDEEDPTSYGHGDPVIVADVGFRFEVFPMPQLIRATR